MIRLQGDGYATPAVRAARVYYPRSSYLNYLPALYSSDDRSRWFSERYLSLFQTEWDHLGKAIENTTALFDPAAVPDRFLDYVAGKKRVWLARRIDIAHAEQLETGVTGKRVGMVNAALAHSGNRHSVGL